MRKNIEDWLALASIVIEAASYVLARVEGRPAKIEFFKTTEKQQQTANVKTKKESNKE